MIVPFLGLVMLSIAIAFFDWRRGWLMAIICGVLQDPVRKMTAGTPVALTFTIVVVYAAVLFAAQDGLRQHLREFRVRFANVAAAAGFVILFVLVAALNGIVNFGIANWKVPLISLFLYMAPLPAIFIGYMYLRREKMLYGFLRFYALLTSVALVGTLLEFLRVDWRALGLVANVKDYIRHLPGIQIRMLSGFYRAPDIMAWHAAMLTCIAIFFAIRAGLGRQVWLWVALAGWGFLSCVLSGRRKAVYFVAVFMAVFLWRYIKRMHAAQLVAFAIIFGVLGYVVYDLSTDRRSSVYTTGAMTTRSEVASRLEGGVVESVRQFGFLGAGLGTATQGVHHLLPSHENLGWQEGGLGKLVVELGVPGLLATFLLALVLSRTMLRIANHPDIEGSSQLARVALFALITANAVNFLASAQAYTDPVLILITAFLIGCFFATAVLDERLAESPVRPPQPLTAPATA